MPTPLHLLTDTWPNDGQTYNAIRMDVTDNNNGANNALIRFRRGGVDRFVVDPEGNITTGLCKTFTTSQLNALDATTSKRLAFAYCTDCLNLGSAAVGATGAFVRWSDVIGLWVTMDYSIPITTNFCEFVMQAHVRNPGTRITQPYAYHLSSNPSSHTFGVSVPTNGASWGFGSTDAANADFGGYVDGLITGTTAGSAYALARFNRPQISSFGSSQRRSVGIVATISNFPGSNSSTDQYAFRIGIQDADRAANDWPSTFCGFVFQDQVENFGASGPGTSANMRWIMRGNSTTATSGSTGFTSSSTGLLLAATIEPDSSGTSATFRIGYQQGNNQAVFQTQTGIAVGTGANLQLQAHVANCSITNRTTSFIVRFPRLSLTSIITAGSLVAPYKINLLTP